MWYALQCCKKSSGLTWYKQTNNQTSVKSSVEYLNDVKLIEGQQILASNDDHCLSTTDVNSFWNLLVSLWLTSGENKHQAFLSVIGDWSSVCALRSIQQFNDNIWRRRIRSIVSGNRIIRFSYVCIIISTSSLIRNRKAVKQILEFSSTRTCCQVSCAQDVHPKLAVLLPVFWGRQRQRITFDCYQTSFEILCKIKFDSMSHELLSHPL